MMQAANASIVPIRELQLQLKICNHDCNITVANAKTYHGKYLNKEKKYQWYVHPYDNGTVKSYLPTWFATSVAKRI